MEDKKNLNPMKEDALDEVAGGATNYDFYGNPINPQPFIPAAPVYVPAAPVDTGLSATLTNANGATYVCPSCGCNKYKITSANEKEITLKCKKCGTKFTVANV